MKVLDNVSMGVSSLFGNFSRASSRWHQRNILILSSFAKIAVGTFFCWKKYLITLASAKNPLPKGSSIILKTLFGLALTANRSVFSYEIPRVNVDEKTACTMDVQALLKEYVDGFNGVGAVVGLIDQGQTHFFSYGKKSINDEELLSEDTVLEIGSITKVFTTLVLMDLVDKGEMQLDDPIEAYLPGVKVPEKNGKKITLRHLATHYSGLPRMPDNFNPKNTANPYPDYSVDNLYEFLNQHTLQTEPGVQFQYSNIGMGLLGQGYFIKF